MSITDELREWAKTLTHWWYDPVKDEYTYTTGTMPPSIDAIRLDSSIIAIADRIDAEHEEAIQQALMGEGGVPATDENMAEHGWIRLPKDADGVPIRVGDVMEERSGHTFEVASLMAFGGSANWLVLSDPRNFSSFREPHDIRHYHAPTVEDVLREFAYGLGVPVADSYIAASAAKLRLAEGEDA